MYAKFINAVEKITINFKEICFTHGRLTKLRENCSNHESDNFTSGAVGRNI